MVGDHAARPGKSAAVARGSLGGSAVSVAIDARTVVRERSFVRTFSNATGMAGIVAAILFSVFPEIDLQFGRLFWEPGWGFLGNHNPRVALLRWIFIVFYFACIALAIFGLLRTHGRGRVWLSLGLPQWLFLAVCLGVGPGLVANLLLKDQWGRARPKHVAEFGGEKAFTPALAPGRECRRGCSFVSGEAASVFVPFYAAALVLPQRSLLLVSAGTAAGLCTGLIRISQGAHFLSDVIFAGVLMALTVLIVRRLMFAPRWGPPRPRPGGVRY
jgi:lipid A 4'-phosphatase